MADNPGNRGAQDRARINMQQEHEVRYWTEKFNVSREVLQQAVDAAGPMADAVEKALRSSGRAGHA
jgi:hypothetical protein